MKKASELIKQSCCGNMLDVPKCELVAMVEKLEVDNKNLIAALQFMMQRPFDESDFVSMVDQCNKILNKATQ